MTNDLFEKVSVPRAYFKLALPVVFSMVVSLVYNMVDTFFIARTQNADLVAGVSLCAPVFTLMIALGDIFGLGGSSVISRLFGEKRDEDGRRASAFCFYGAIVCGIAVAGIMLFFQKPILYLLGAGEGTYEFASQYYTYMAIGAPAVILALTPGNLMRTEGLAVEAMAGTIIGSLVNIILDPVFIFGLGMGAGGAAIATVLGNLATDVILIGFVLRKSGKLSVSIRAAGISRREMLGIFAIGIPASVTNLMQSLGMALMNRYLVPYGTKKVAAMGIAMKVNMIVMLVMVGFAFGAQPLIGYNYGAGNKERLQKIIRFDLGVEVVFALVFSLLLAWPARQILSLFMKDAQIVEAGSLMLRCLLVTMPFVGIVLVFTTVFQAAGKALPAFLLSVSRQGRLWAVCIAVLSRTAGYHGVIVSQAAADVLTAVLAAVLYYRGFGRNAGKGTF